MSMEESAVHRQVLKRKPTKMKSFTEALRDKYCDPGDIGNNVNINIVIFGKPSRKRGDSSSSDTDAELGHLRTVVLNQMTIGFAGLPSSGLTSLCPNIIDLDLQGNCLTSWTETLTILSQLPCLKFVNLSSNKITNDQNCLQTWEKPVKCLEDMVLNRTGMTWDEVLSLVRLAPNLKELHICENDYEKIGDGDLTVLAGIETLRMNNNNIREWSEFWKLRHLLQLQNLILSGNPVEVVFYDQSGVQSSVFGNSTCEDSEDLCTAIVDEVISLVSMDSENVTKNVDPTSSDPQPDMSSCDQTKTLPDESMDISKEILDEVLEGVTQIANNVKQNINPKTGSCENCNQTNNCDMDKTAGNLDNAVRITVLNSGKCTRENFSLKTKNCCEINIDEETTYLTPNKCDNELNLPRNIDQSASEQDNTSQLPFHNLSMLCLSQTKLSDWAHLHAMNSFPKLKSLRITGISLADELSLEERRKLFLACLPSIEVLNGGEISQTERDKAERHFLRHFLSKDEKPLRYQELELKHGTPEPLVDIDLTRGFQEWVSVKFVFNGNEVLEDQIRVVENVGKLKTFIRKKLCKKLGITRFKMWHLACGPFHSAPAGVEFEELFLDSLPLSRFDIQEADEIHIEKVEGFLPRVTCKPVSSLQCSQSFE